jgi:hypothetical protein
MNAHKHHAWRPHMSSGSVFNPFVRSTQPEASLDRPTLDEEIEDVTPESEGESEPIKPDPS